MRPTSSLRRFKAETAKLIKRRRTSTANSPNASVLQPLFIRHVHELLLLGYQRLNAASMSKSKEEDITGELKKAIESVLDDRPQSWMVYYFAEEESPVNDGVKKGKNRKRLDLHVVSSRHNPRPRFSIEAKPLGAKHRVSLYLGKNGIGRFLRGEYARDSDHAGMIGYVQSGSLAEWEKKLIVYFSKQASELNADSRGFSTHLIVHAGCPGFLSLHQRATVGRAIHIYHTLLVFH